VAHFLCDQTSEKWLKFKLSNTNVAERGWSNGSDVVILTNYNAYADALAASPLAYYKNAPILLTHSDRLTGITKKELVKLSPKHVIIIGGNGSISEKVLHAVKEIGIQRVSRIAGADRYEVSYNIAKELPANNTAVIAYGLNFPDALAIAPYAAVNGMPILLTKKDDIPVKTKKALSQRQVQSTIVVGGEGSVGNSVYQALPNPQRIGGKDRFEVVANIIKQLDIQSKKTLVATGMTFADALTGSVLAAKENASILLTYSDRIPEETQHIVSKRNLIVSPS
jgi:N-acetylmuramoyl-L-alanine amidase